MDVVTVRDGLVATKDTYIDTASYLAGDKSVDRGAEFVSMFERVLEHFAPRIHPEIVAMQPMAPVVHGHAAFEQMFRRFSVPSEVIDVLRWHTETQLITPEQKASELLFPAEDGSFRSECFLTKAFATVGHLIGLKKNFTPRGMRRTLERMREHYSTVTPDEQRSSIGNVVHLFGRRPSGEDSGERPIEVGRK